MATSIEITAGNLQTADKLNVNRAMFTLDWVYDKNSEITGTERRN